MVLIHSVSLVRFSNFVATMVGLKGMSKEPNSMHNLMNRGSTDVSTEEAECGYFRQGTYPLLVKLESN
jgi:hypothetical protein